MFEKDLWVGIADKSHPQTAIAPAAAARHGGVAREAGRTPGTAFYSGQIRSIERNNNMTEKETRKRFGLTGKPINATRVLEKPMNSGDFNGQDSKCLMVIDDNAQTITPMNTYNGNAGANFNPQPRALPAQDSERMRDYLGARGYKPGKVSDHPALKEVQAKTPAAAATK